MSYKNDKLFKEIADTYVERYGERLHKERGEIPPRETPWLDWRVKACINARSTRRSWAVAGMVAAALLLVFALPQLSSLITGFDPTQSLDSTPAPGQAQQSVIPLGFSLPEQFTVADVEQDQGKTIYYLRDAKQDDVVLTLEMDARVQTNGLEEIPLERHTVHGAYRADYSMLTFSKDNIVYELSCRHDLNTLVELSRGILA